MTIDEELEQVFAKVIVSTAGQSLPTTIIKLKALIASEREKARKDARIGLLEYLIQAGADMDFYGWLQELRAMAYEQAHRTMPIEGEETNNAPEGQKESK